MLLIAQNHLQLIVEVAIMLFVTWIFVLNLIPLSLSVVTFLSLFLLGGFTVLFGADIALLIISSSQAEFTHPFGPIALLGAVTALASLKVMKESGVDIRPLRRFVILFIAGITVFGGLMHRSFLILWILGLFFGYLIISKSFREKSIFTFKRIFSFLGILAVGFVLLEIVSRVTGMTIFSPMLRLGRIEQYSLSSIKTVLHNIQLIGHSAKASYWGAEGTALMYREKREKNNKKFLGREVLLTGALAAFSTQALIGMFVFNRTINGMALLTFLFIGTLILANVVTLKTRS